MTSLKSFSEDAGEDIRSRRNFIESQTNASLGCLASRLTSKYYSATENTLGTIQLPIAVAGPVKFSLSSKVFESYIPLSTTEGALVASLNRGCKAITESGKAKVNVFNHGITRAPIFKAGSVEEAQKVADYCVKNIDKLNKIIKQESKHTTLIKIHPLTMAERVFLRFHFDTGKAMGMNMATIASQTIAEHLIDQFDIKLISVSSNFCTDKKASFSNMVSGRGREITASVVIERKTLKKVLKTTPEALMEVYQSKLVLGSYLSGSTGFNAHFANTAVAIFIATGQDPAHVVEASQGITSLEIKDKGVLFTCWVPNLIVGLVGGGTHYPTQKACLSIMNHQNSVDNLAGIIGAAMLAGEISLLASLAEGSLAKIHQI